MNGIRYFTGVDKKSSEYLTVGKYTQCLDHKVVCTCQANVFECVCACRVCVRVCVRAVCVYVCVCMCVPCVCRCVCVCATSIHINR